MERRIAKYDYDACGLAAVTPLRRILRLRAFRRAAELGDLVKRVEERFWLVAASGRLQRVELRLDLGRAANERIVDIPVTAVRIDVAIADDAGAPVLDDSRTVGVRGGKRIKKILNVLLEVVDRRLHAAGGVDEKHDVADALCLRGGGLDRGHRRRSFNRLGCWNRRDGRLGLRLFCSHCCFHFVSSFTVDISIIPYFQNFSRCAS